MKGTREEEENEWIKRQRCLQKKGFLLNQVPRVNSVQRENQKKCQDKEKTKKASFMRVVDLESSSEKEAMGNSQMTEEAINKNKATVADFWSQVQKKNQILNQVKFQKSIPEGGMNRVKTEKPVEFFGNQFTRNEKSKRDGCFGFVNEKDLLSSSSDSLVVIDSESDSESCSSTDSSVAFLNNVNPNIPLHGLIKQEAGQNQELVSEEQKKENSEKGRKKRQMKKKLNESNEAENKKSPKLRGRKRGPKNKKKDLEEETNLGPNSSEKKRRGGRRKKIKMEGEKNSEKEQGNPKADEKCQEKDLEDNKPGEDNPTPFMEEVGLNYAIQEFESEAEFEEEICLKNEKFVHLNVPQTRPKPEEGLLKKRFLGDMSEGKVGKPSSFQRFILNRKRQKISKNERLETNSTPVVAKIIKKHALLKNESLIDTCSPWLCQKIKTQLIKRICEKMPTRTLEEISFILVETTSKKKKEERQKEALGVEDDIEPGELSEEEREAIREEVTGKRKVEIAMDRFVESLVQKRSRASVQPLFFFYESGFRRVPWSRLTEKENKLLFENGLRDVDAVGFFDYLFQKYIDAAHIHPFDKRITRKSQKFADEDYHR